MIIFFSIQQKLKLKKLQIMQCIMILQPNSNYESPSKSHFISTAKFAKIFARFAKI